MTADNPIKLEGTGFSYFAHSSVCSKTVLQCEDQELNLIFRGFILRLPYKVFCSYRLPNFLDHPGNSSPLWNLIIIFIIIIIIIIIVIIIFIIIIVMKVFFYCWIENSAMH